MSKPNTKTETLTIIITFISITVLISASKFFAQYTMLMIMASAIIADNTPNSVFCAVTLGAAQGMTQFLKYDDSVYRHPHTP